MLFRSRRYLAAPDLIHPALRIGTKTQAAGLMLRTMLTRKVDLDVWERRQNYPLLKEPVLAADSPDWRRDAARAQLNLLSPTIPNGRAA